MPTSATKAGEIVTMNTKSIRRLFALAVLVLSGATTGRSSISEYNYYDHFAYLSWEEVITETEYQNGEIFHQTLNFSYGSTTLAPNDVHIANDAEEPDDEYVLTFGWSGKVKYTEYNLIDFYPL